MSRFLDTDIAEIRIFSRDEKKQDDMRQMYKSPKVKFYVGDVRDYSSVSQAMQSVDFVFHAAALKQVPSCEFQPMEAVKTNVMATRGSVIPLLVSQVLSGRPITVTDGYLIDLSCVFCKLFVAFRVGSNGLPKQRNTPTRSAMFSVLFCYERFIR